MYYEKFTDDWTSVDHAELGLTGLSEVLTARRAVDDMQQRETAAAVTGHIEDLSMAAKSGDPAIVLNAYASLERDVQVRTHDELLAQLGRQADQLMGEPDEDTAVLCMNEDAQTIIEALRQYATPGHPGFNADKAAEAAHMLAQVGLSPVELKPQLAVEEVPAEVRRVVAPDRRSLSAGLLSHALRFASFSFLSR